ncbi:MAG: hypothetical protein JSU07_01470 [Bacteroidetes bacterium]|nr:hypothetical protein [Bacteroidota bacterium]
MKAIKLTKGIVILAASGALLTVSCKKKENPTSTTPTPDTETTTASQSSTAENISNDIQNIGGQATSNSSGQLTTYRNNGETEFRLESSPCATVSISGNTYSVNFGSGCTGFDGRTRSGMLVYTVNMPGAYYRTPGFSFTVTSQSYVVDGNAVTINNKVVTNTTPPGFNPASTNLTWSVTANLSINLASGAGTVTYNTARTHTLANTSDTTVYHGQSTAISWNKAHLIISGNSNGVNTKGENYTAVATNLIRNFDCIYSSGTLNQVTSFPSTIFGPRPYIGGTLAYTPGTRSTRTINFGNGTCSAGNNTVSVTINNNTYSFTRP